MSDVEIGNAIIAGIADGDTILEKMSEVVEHLRLAGFIIVPIDGVCAQRALTPPDPEWLRRKSETDPDIDCEAGGIGLLTVKDILEEADQYRHPDFDSDCEKLVVKLADALLAALTSTERKSGGQSMDEAAADNFGLTVDDLDEDEDERS
jgi:hypothetical protein